MSIESDNKPQSFMDTLGPKIEMETKALQPDEWARTHLKEIGKHLGAQFTAQGLEYVGSFAFHLLKTKDGYGQITGEYHMDSITQVALDENISEQMAMLAFNNGVLQMRRYFRPETKTGKRGDKR